jgi:hypothetical protein
MSSIITRAFPGQDIVDLYFDALKENETITHGEIITWIKFKTKIALAQFNDQGEFQFRMETFIKDDWPPICRYVTVNCDGVMKFREIEQWFIAGDMLFESFRLALDFLFKETIG